MVRTGPSGRPRFPTRASPRRAPPLGRICVRRPRGACRSKALGGASVPIRPTLTTGTGSRASRSRGGPAGARGGGRPRRRCRSLRHRGRPRRSTGHQGTHGGQRRFPWPPTGRLASCVARARRVGRGGTGHVPSRRCRWAATTPWPRDVGLPIQERRSSA